MQVLHEPVLSHVQPHMNVLGRGRVLWRPQGTAQDPCPTPAMCHMALGLRHQGYRPVLGGSHRLAAGLHHHGDFMLLECVNALFCNLLSLSSSLSTSTIHTPMSTGTMWPLPVVVVQVQRCLDGVCDCNRSATLSQDKRPYSYAFDCRAFARGADHFVLTVCAPGGGLPRIVIAGSVVSNRG